MDKWQHWLDTKEKEEEYTPNRAEAILRTRKQHSSPEIQKEQLGTSSELRNSTTSPLSQRDITSNSTVGGSSTHLLPPTVHKRFMPPTESTSKADQDQKEQPQSEQNGLRLHALLRRVNSPNKDLNVVATASPGDGQEHSTPVDSRLLKLGRISGLMAEDDMAMWKMKYWKRNADSERCKQFTQCTRSYLWATATQLVRVCM